MKSGEEKKENWYYELNGVNRAIFGDQLKWWELPLSLNCWGQEETFPWFLLLSRCFKLPNLHVQLTLLFWIPDVISNYPQNFSIWMFHRYKSACSEPKSSTWSFSCSFHFSKRLHIPCSHQSVTTSLELVILFSISPLQSCLVEGGLYFTQIHFIRPPHLTHEHL